jgi:hypothetical protein
VFEYPSSLSGIENASNDEHSTSTGNHHADRMEYEFNSYQRYEVRNRAVEPRCYTCFHHEPGAPLCSSVRPWLKWILPVMVFLLVTGILLSRFGVNSTPLAVAKEDLTGFAPREIVCWYKKYSSLSRNNDSSTTKTIFLPAENYLGSQTYSYFKQYMEIRGALQKNKYGQTQKCLRVVVY